MEADRYNATSFGRPRRTGGHNSYVAYYPAPIPREIELPIATVGLLADAEGALGQLAGVGRLLPNPDLLIRPYLLREALSSTRIEGTQASMVEVLEADAGGEARSEDVDEVVNYARAMRLGLDRLAELPISTRLIREIHGELMVGARGQGLSPGELRTSQNWVGPSGSTIATAPFVPPPPEELDALLTDWERFANEDIEMPVLVQDALLHAQFETIHPFLDGNGRLGRLVVVFFLVARGRLPSPLLYLSAYLETHRSDYYAALQSIREAGDPLPWLDLFLTAVRSQAQDAVTRAAQILDIREDYRAKTQGMSSPNAAGLVEMVCVNPIVTARSVEDGLDVSRPTALRLLISMEQHGVLGQASPGARGQRRYVAREIMDAVTGELDG